MLRKMRNVDNVYICFSFGAHFVMSSTDHAQNGLDITDCYNYSYLFFQIFHERNKRGYLAVFQKNCYIFYHSQPA